MTHVWRLKHTATLGWLLAVMLLAACEFTISGEITLRDNIRNASYSTNFEAVIDGEERFVICNDRTTTLTYSFTYEDRFTNWTSYLQGVDSGDIRGEVDLNLNDSRVQVNGNRVTVTYEIQAGAAPTLSEPVLDSQAIVVVPDAVGYTRLYIRTADFANPAPLISNPPIPVLANCQNASQPEPVSVSNAGYDTSYEATINGEPRNIICDNRLTELNYRFNYTGDLTTWTSFLKGDTTGTVRGETSFNSSQITTPGQVDVTYSILANGAPLLTDGGLSPQAIVVTPVPNPTVIGSTRLFIRVNGLNEEIPLSSNSIPVVSNCP